MVGKESMKTEKRINSADKNYESIWDMISALKRYRFLIKQLVVRDFKLKYKRSILGVLWSFLNPLLHMTVLYVVFSSLFRFDVEHYPVYLLAGIVMFSFFSEASALTMNSIVNNANLIKKVYVPKYIYPLTRTASSMINLLISMIPLIAAVIFSGIRPSLSVMLAIVPIFCISVFCLGIGMILATLMAFFRDIEYLWGIISTIWMYLTPIFYPISIIPDKVAWIIKGNPIFHYVDFLRTCIIDGCSPAGVEYAVCFGSAALTLVIGICVFRKAQDKFILYM